MPIVSALGHGHHRALVLTGCWEGWKKQCALGGGKPYPDVLVHISHREVKKTVPWESGLELSLLESGEYVPHTSIMSISRQPSHPPVFNMMRCQLPRYPPRIPL